MITRGEMELLGFVLTLPELCVERLGIGQQLVVGPCLHYSSLVQDQDLIASHHRRQPVGDEDGGAALGGFVQGPHDTVPHDRVERQSGFFKVRTGRGRYGMVVVGRGE